MTITLYSLAQRYIGMALERQGAADHPLIQWWLSLCGYGLDVHDEVPWCSAFVNGLAWELRLPRSKSAAARSWLTVGTPVDTPICGFDLVVYRRGPAPQPGPEVIQAPGHVNIFGAFDGESVLGIGGNQGNNVSLTRMPKTAVLGYRRILTP